MKLKHQERRKGISSISSASVPAGMIKYRKSRGFGFIEFLQWFTYIVIIPTMLIVGVFAIMKLREQTKKEHEESNKRYSACTHDPKCWAERYKPYASGACSKHIENLAKYSFEWTNNFMQPKFDQYKWIDESKRSITYMGDKIRFQNFFGAMENYSYECDLYFDNSYNLISIGQVRAKPGRLNK